MSDQSKRPESLGMILPGPSEIEPGQCPGGVVVHVYGVPSGTLLNTSMAATEPMAAYNAGADYREAERNLPDGDVAFCLVAYNGDDGHRFTAVDWTS